MDYSARTHSYKKKTRGKRKAHTVLAFGTTLFLLIIIILVIKSLHHASPQVTQAETIEHPEAASIQNDGLAQAIKSTLVGTSGTYGIVVKNLKTNTAYYAQEHTSFKTGSLYKLWVMAVVYEQIHEGKLRKDQILSQDVVKLNEKFNLASASAEFNEGVMNLSVSDALTKMITVSDNYSALLLAEKIRLSTIAEFLHNHGFNESAVGINGNDPMSTPYDISLFFEKLSKGELADETSTEEMLQLLKNQRLNDKLPKYLPEDITLAHKTGELWSVTHDAGIVYTPKGNYLIVVLSDSNDPPAAEERIAEISKEVYTYFSN